MNIRRSGIIQITFAVMAFLVLLLPAAASAGGVGAVVSAGLSADGRSVELKCENARVVLRAFERGIVSVEVLAETVNSGYETHMTLPEALEGDKFIFDAARGEASNSGVRVKFTRSLFTLDVASASGKPLLALAADGVELNPDGSYGLTFLKEKGDRYLGMGEQRPSVLGDKKIGLDFNRMVVDIWNIHPQAYMVMPFFMNPRGYGLLIENPFKAQFDFKSQGTFTYSATGGPLRFYVFPSDSLYEILDEYSKLTGRTPMPPRWTTGYMQSRSCFLDKKYFEWRVSNFRKRKIPADVLIYDNYWTQQNPDDSLEMGNLRWNEKVFPDSLNWVKKTHRLGFKTIVIVQPYVSDNSLTFKEVTSGRLATTDDKGQQLLMCGGCYWKRQSLLLDFTNPATRDWFGRKVRAIRATGVDAWWTDLTEPEWDSDDMVYHDGYRRNAVHNIYALLMHKAMYDMYRKELPDERLFILSRSGFTGDWRYGTGVWSGDVRSSWYQFNEQVPIGIGTSLSGFSMWNSDVGGFSGKPTPEIFVRWMQFGAFCPIYRAHGDATHEPWMYGEEAEKYNREIINLRYRMAPYLYSLFYEMNRFARPVMRALLLEFPDDWKAYEVANEYMYGPWLLVAPVTKEKATSRKVYLPAGTWTDYWTGETIAGPATVTAEAPLNRIPLYVREGAIIPMAPLMQYTEEKPVDPLTLDIYPGAKPSEFSIYEDDGTTNRYLKGEFALTKVDVQPNVQPNLGGISVSVSMREGRYAGMPVKRAYVVVCRSAARPSIVLLDGKPVAESKAVAADAAERKAAWSYDAAAKAVKVFVPRRASGFEARIR